MEPLEIVDYDASGPAAFEAERERLRAALGELALRIEHKGSTAVPGLAAKPVIDIQVSVARLQPMSAYREPLRGAGYTHRAHPDDSFCPFFHRPARWPHSHHVHVVEAGGAEERRTLAFRDALRGDTALAEQYAALKRRLAPLHAADDPEARDAYAEAKGEFVEGVLATVVSSS